MSNQEIIIFPDKTLFSTELTIRKIDLSMDLHVSFASVLDLVFEAHLQFFEHLGYAVTDIHGKSIIFANLNIQYQGELFYKDKVRIDVGINNMQSKYMDLFFRLVKDEKSPVSIVKIRVLFFDYSLRKVVEIPDGFRQRFPEISSAQPPKSRLEPADEKWRDMRIRKLAGDLAEEVYRFTQSFPASEEENLTAKLRILAVNLISNLTQSYHNKLNSDKVKSVLRLEATVKELEELLILSSRLGFGKEPPMGVLGELGKILEEFRNKIFSGKKINLKEVEN